MTQVIVCLALPARTNDKSIRVVLGTFVGFSATRLIDPAELPAGSSYHLGDRGRRHDATHDHLGA